MGGLSPQTPDSQPVPAAPPVWVGPPGACGWRAAPGQEASAKWAAGAFSVPKLVTPAVRDGARNANSVEMKPLFSSSYHWG